MPALPPHADMVQLRRMLDRQDVGALVAFLADHPYAATAPLVGWSDHPRGVSPLAYVAMARYDTATGVWRDVPGSASAVRALLAAGAPVDGHPDDEETPLITAASYGDADVAAALVAAGAEVDAVASDRSGGVPAGSALLHAAVFGMTDVVDVLVAAGATVRSVEEAAAAGDIAGWVDAETDEQAKIRALVMAADHQRLEVIAELVAAGTPADEPDRVFGRHPLRLAAANGRPSSVVALLRHGANPALRDAMGRTPLDHCRLGRAVVADTRGHDAVEAILEPLTPEAGRF